MNYSIAFAAEAEADLRKMDPLVASAVLDALDAVVAGDPYDHLALPHFPYKSVPWLIRLRCVADGDPWSIVAGARVDVPAKVLHVLWILAQAIPDYGSDS